MVLQSGLEGIFGDVTNSGFVVVPVPNNTVKAFVLPERPVPAKAALNLLSREPFPGIAHLLQLVSIQHTTQDVHMVGHDHIAQHFTALAFEVMQCSYHCLPMPCFAQKAFPVIFIEQSFQFAEA